MPPPAGSVVGKGDGCASGLVVDGGVAGIEAMVGVMVGVPVEAVAGLVVVGPTPAFVAVMCRTVSAVRCMPRVVACAVPP